MKACFDTNIVIDFLNGRLEAKELFSIYEPSISAIAYLATFVKLSAHVDPKQAQTILSGLDVIPVDRDIAELAARFRSEKQLKTPDAIIYGTAVHLGVVLITRNTRDFKESDPYIKVPYHA